MTAYISKQLNTKGHPLHLWILIGVIVVLSVLYGYFLNAAIISVIARESLENNVSLISSNIGTLEGQLLALERPLTTDAVADYGLSVPKDVTYVGENSGTILTFGQNI